MFKDKSGVLSLFWEKLWHIVVTGTPNPLSSKAAFWLLPRLRSRFRSQNHRSSKTNKKLVSSCLRFSAGDQTSVGRTAVEQTRPTETRAPNLRRSYGRWAAVQACSRTRSRSPCLYRCESSRHCSGDTRSDLRKETVRSPHEASFCSSLHSAKWKLTALLQWFVAPVWTVSNLVAHFAHLDALAAATLELLGPITLSHCRHTHTHRSGLHGTIEPCYIVHIINL